MIASLFPITTFKENGTTIYFNPTIGVKCTSADAVSNTGTKTGCMKWYVFNDVDGNSTVNLILDHNTTATTAWNTSGSNVAGPSELTTQLWSDTDSWANTLIRTDSYNVSNGKATYTIDYNNHKARLITGAEVAKITGNNTYAEAITDSLSWFFFDTNTQTASTTCKEGDTTGCKYGWLYDRTYTTCETYGCSTNSDVSTSGYWTATSIAGGNSYALVIVFSGRVDTSTAVSDNGYGVLPVITVSKSLIY